MGMLPFCFPPPPRRLSHLGEEMPITFNALYSGIILLRAAIWLREMLSALIQEVEIYASLSLAPLPAFSALYT